tara:strand:- start:2110 stop:2538 length:429 start_codon:yes stop_codon:yes gene_type:complete
MKKKYGIFNTIASSLENNYFGIFVVVSLLLVAALVRSNLHLVRTKPLSSAQYQLFENMIDSPERAFCGSHDNIETREKECNKLSEGVCSEAGCCVWAHTGSGVQACVAGDHHGPVYLSDPDASLTYDVTKYVHKAEEFVIKS